MQSTLLRIAAAAALLTPFALAQNDDCTGALPILDGANGPFTNAGSTTSTPTWSCAAGGNDIWFSYVASATGTCAIDACGGSYDTALEVFDGSAGCGGLVFLACDDDSCGLQSRVIFQAVVGTTYYVRLGGYNGNTGTAPLNVTPPTPPQPNTLTTNYFGTYYATAPATFFFDLTVVNQLIFTSMDVNLESVASTPGTIDVYSVPTTWVGNDQNPAAWTLLGSGTVTAAGQGQPSAVTLQTGFMPLAAGTYGIAIQYNGVNPIYEYLPTAGTYTTPELTMVTGAIAYGALGTAAYTQYEWNGTIRYQANSSPIALATSYGEGCYAQRASFYELFPSGSFDLSNTSFQMIFTGNGYVMTPGSTNWFTPVSGNLGLTDDSVSAAQALPFTLLYPGGTTNSVWVSSNGFVWLESSTSSWCCNGDPVTLLSDLARICPAWGDLNPTNGGSIHFDVDPSNTAAYVTFLGVPEFGNTANTNTFQVAFFDTGAIEVRYQTAGSTGHDVLAGFSPGHGALDPGSIDLTAAIPAGFQTAPDLQPLALTAGARPIAGTVVPLTLSNIPGPSLGLVVLSFGAVVPGLDLGYLGMPGCTQHIALGGAVTLGAVVGNGSIPLSIPTDPFYLGFNVFAQGAALVSGVNPLGGLASNGVRLVFGSL
jgi:hypothetical protein